MCGVSTPGALWGESVTHSDVFVCMLAKELLEFLLGVNLNDGVGSYLTLRLMLC